MKVASVIEKAMPPDGELDRINYPNKKDIYFKKNKK